MGINVELYFEQIGELKFESLFPIGWEVCEIQNYKKENHEGATHEFVTMSRLYDIGYERGSWPDICSVLMLLFACPGVGRVWYGGDLGDRIPEFTPNGALKLSRHFMGGGLTEGEANAAMLSHELAEALRELADFSVNDTHYRNAERSKTARSKAYELLERLGF